MNPKVTVLIPALNEEEAIGLVIDEIREASVHCNILVGDNNSTDDTVEVCRDRGIEPISITTRGKGSAVQTLIDRVETPFTVMVNADYTYPIKASLPIIAWALEELHADVVICTRTYKEKEAMSRLNAIGNQILTTAARVLYKYPIKDLCTGLWGFQTDVLKSFDITSTHFTLEADLFINAIKKNCEIYQTPVAYRPRLDESKAKIKVSDGIEILKFLIRYWR